MEEVEEVELAPATRPGGGDLSRSVGRIVLSLAVDKVGVSLHTCSGDRCRQVEGDAR